jgi:YfiH family protein
MRIVATHTADSSPRPTLDDDFEWRQTRFGPAVVCRALEPYASHLFTTRAWPLGSAADSARAAAWDDVARALGVDAAHFVRAHQVHGASVVVRRPGDPGPHADRALPDADILITDDPAIALAVQTADCVPLLIADRQTSAAAAAHAGWRGLAARVPSVAVHAMRDAFGSRPADLIVAIGPSICAARYEVGADVRERFASAPFSDDELARWFLPGARHGHWQFDGWASARDQLHAAGIPGAQIHLAGLCTATLDDLLCSYRRDGKAAGRIAGAIRALPRRP